MNTSYPLCFSDCTLDRCLYLFNISLEYVMITIYSNSFMTTHSPSYAPSIMNTSSPLPSWCTLALYLYFLDIISGLSTRHVLFHSLSWLVTYPFPPDLSYFVISILFSPFLLPCSPTSCQHLRPLLTPLRCSLVFSYSTLHPDYSLIFFFQIFVLSFLSYSVLFFFLAPLHPASTFFPCWLLCDALLF